MEEEEEESEVEVLENNVPATTDDVTMLNAPEYPENVDVTVNHEQDLNEARQERRSPSPTKRPSSIAPSQSSQTSQTPSTILAGLYDGLDHQVQIQVNVSVENSHPILLMYGSDTQLPDQTENVTTRSQGKRSRSESRNRSVSPPKKSKTDAPKTSSGLNQTAINQENDESDDEDFSPSSVSDMSSDEESEKSVPKSKNSTTDVSNFFF